MNRFVTRSLALGMFLLAVTPLLAQRPGGGGMGFGPQGIAQLVNNKSVQEELKLTEDQIAAFKKAGEGVTAKFKEDIDKAKEGKDFAKMGELRKAQTEETNKVMTKVMEDTLKPEQAKRLKQIEYQIGGTRTLATNMEVQKTLKLTESQVGEITAIREEASKDAKEISKGLFGKDTSDEKKTEARKKLTEIEKEATTKIIEKLTPDQKKQWEEMTGPKFELKQEAPKGRRPGV